MLITIKNLYQQTFTIVFQAEKTVLELKQAIFKERGSEYVVDKQKLIYAGIILADDRTLQSYNFDEKKFLVVMLKRDINESIPKNNVAEEKLNKSDDKEKPMEINEGTESVTNTTNSENLNRNSDVTSATESTRQVLTNPNTDRETSANTNSSQRDTNVLETNRDSHMPLGEDYERTVLSLIEMGYNRELVERAMAASFNNPERAVEYLLNGIPEINESFRNTTTESSTRAVASSLVPETQAATQFSSNTAQRQDPFEFLRNQPQFLQMRSLVYQNPDLLHAVLQQIGETNPALLQLISENQDEFLNMLNQPVEDEITDNNALLSSTRSQITATSRSASNNETSNVISSQNSTPLSVTNENVAEVSNENPLSNTGNNPNVPQSLNNTTTESSRGNTTESVTTIRLTQQDQIAVERLKSLGFPEALVLQAYFACERDAQLAANFLFSYSFDD
ncbi:UV excision repair protein RAD23 homolog A [Teleopsis dalmanni]|uniref:UV excision repair protein RAD23 homolog A n=1 Tax=Teleopsis dalmanni TaxID=139649 RepID=UPI0018CEC742|nr:UV excision repair protein RAD23 homolog A [Teleopsis dalmanni]